MRSKRIIRSSHLRNCEDKKIKSGKKIKYLDKNNKIITTTIKKDKKGERYYMHGNKKRYLTGKKSVRI
jgi:hypothetical protein